MGMMQQTLDRLQQEGKLNGSCDCRWLTDSTQWDKKWQQELQSTDLVLMKWMGSGLDTPFLQKLLPYMQKLRLPFYIDASGSKEGELSQNLSAQQIAIIKQYAMYGGEKNYYYLWQYLKQLITGLQEEIPEPNPIHWTGIFHPRAKHVYTDLAAYEQDFCQSGRPTVGMLFYRDEWVWGDLEYQSAMVEALEAQGVNVICVFTNGIPNTEIGMPSLPEVVSRFFCKQGLPIIDALINVMKFSLTSSGALTVDNLKQWNVPVLQAYTIMAPYEEWRDSFEGMNAMEISISISLPEFDGIIHGVPIACKKVLSNGDVRYQPIPERVERMASKAAKWARLRHKANAEKKIAIIFHNYPPRNSNIGSALGLDTIESIRRVLATMRERGYRVDTIP